MKKRICMILVAAFVFLAMFPAFFQTAVSAAYVVYPGDTVFFGKFEQDNNMKNGEEAIEWIVLDTDKNGNALIISKYILFASGYHVSLDHTTWDDCTLRDWLNDVFYNSAFDSWDQNKIFITKHMNPDNPKYGTEGGRDTEDKVFLLSIDEARYYFSSDAERKSETTKFAEKHGCETSGASARGWYWLRSPGSNGSNAAFVSPSGEVYTKGSSVDYEGHGIRPAMWVNLNK